MHQTCMPRVPFYTDAEPVRGMLHYAIDNINSTLHYAMNNSNFKRNL